MNLKIPLLTFATITIGILIAEEQRLSILRHSIDQLSAELSKAQDQSSASLAELATLRERNDALASESAQLRDRLAQAKSSTPLDPNHPSTPTGDSPKPDAKPEKANWMAGFAKMFNDPEIKKLVQSQQSAGTRMLYSDLGKELNFSPELTTQVLNLLAERQNASSTPNDPPSPKIAEINAQLQSLLGPEKAAKLTEYERTTGDRMAIRQYQRSFSTAGLPLDDPQSAALLKIMKEERLKVPPSPLEPGNQSLASSMAALQNGDNFEQSLQTERGLQARVLARAHTILTPDQMTTFESSQKQQLQRQEMSIKMGKAIFGGAK
ncbi:MAG: hypothetical protein WCI46_09490 [Verrucomicrobiota bacterium]